MSFSGPCRTYCRLNLGIERHILIKDSHSFRFSDLIGYVTPYRHTLLLALFFMLAASAISLLNPWIAGQFTLALLNNTTPLGLSLDLLILAWLVILAAQAVFSFANQYFLSSTSEQMLTGLRVRVYDHLQALPLAYFHERKRGTVLTLLTHDADIISGFVTGTLLSLLPQLLTLVGALAMIFWIDPLVATVIATLIPLFYFVMKIIGRRLRPLTGEMMEEYGKTFAIAEENLGLLPVIKSFTRETLESARFSQGNQRLLALHRRYYRIQAFISPAIQFLAAAGILLLLWISGHKLLDHSISVGDLVSLLLYGMLLTRPVSGLADVYGQIQSARGAAGRLIDLFSSQPEPLDAGTRTLEPAKGHICFHDVSFSYPGRHQLLDKISLEINAGETIAITGKNGEGKSTLAHLLMRFIPAGSGEITIDGVNIDDTKLANLRRQIGLVQQNVLLLNGSVRDNIAYGVPDASDGDIAVAAKAARALEFIEELPDGYDTVIGDQGIKLSGGQKQRLALARALLMDAPILILDEATAMFDPEAEKHFIEECHAVLSQRTVILITHRLASLALADRVLKVEAGRIAANS